MSLCLTEHTTYGYLNHISSTPLYAPTTCSVCIPCTVVHASLPAPLPLYCSCLLSLSSLFFSSHTNSEPVTQCVDCKSMCMAFHTHTHVRTHTHTHTHLHTHIPIINIWVLFSICIKSEYLHLAFLKRLALITVVQGFNPALISAKTLCILLWKAIFIIILSISIIT